MTGGSTSQSLRSGTPSRRTPTRALKRKRTMLEESSSYSLADFITTSSAKGDMEVAEVDPEGKFIRLLNKGEKVRIPRFFLLRVFLGNPIPKKDDHLSQFACRRYH